MSQTVEIRWRGRPVQLELRWVPETGLPGLPGMPGAPAAAPRAAPAPLIVFLHEGLGSVSMWRDFPDRLCRAVGARGLVYSRPGYGRSTPRAPDEAWSVDFMHQQAHEVLPALLQALKVDPAQERLLLFGHSDGGSIALLFAAHPAARLAGLIVMAPHIRVEPLSIASIEKARTDYLETDLRQRLSRHHDDPDSAFWGWNDVWLHPPFRQWTIEPEIGSISCPVLAIQGLDDEYGTLEQIRGIARRVPQTRLLEIPQCGHSPHRDQPDIVIAAVRSFL
ncbi:MAG: alpha/beta hydrolase [Rubrivivax sp.]|nr:alpha/beta hydrolase [Rubrivivax sp.]